MQGSPARLIATLTGVLVLAMIAAGVMLAALVRIPEPARTAQAGASLSARLPAAGARSTPTAIRVSPGSDATPGGLTPAPATAEALPSPPPPSPDTPVAPQVRLTEPLSAVTIPAGTELVLDLTGTPTSAWRVRSNSDPGVLRPSGLPILLAAATLHAVYVGVRTGTSTLEVDRTGLCVWAPIPGDCPPLPYRISVTVVPR
jgi:hypothetical protein